MNIRVVLLFSFVSIGVACSGTVGNDSVASPTPQPSSVTSQKAPQDQQNANSAPDSDALMKGALMAGTWKHVSTAQKPDGERKPLTTANISWTFNADGTGIYKQIVSAVPGASGDNKFKWDLVGNDIKITPVAGGEPMTYTIVGRTDKEMTWRNPVLGDYYIVQKQ